MQINFFLLFTSFSFFLILTRYIQKTEKINFKILQMYNDMEMK